MVKLRKGEVIDFKTRKEAEVTDTIIETLVQILFNENKRSFYHYLQPVSSANNIDLVIEFSAFTTGCLEVLSWKLAGLSFQGRQ